jgi:hypothetical protein
MTKHDDFSCDPSEWSQDKLFKERRNGMPAVVAEYDRRMSMGEGAGNEQPAVPRRTDDFSCDPSRWSESKLFKEKRNGMPAVLAEVERRAEEREAKEGSDYPTSGLSFR